MNSDEQIQTAKEVCMNTVHEKPSSELYSARNSFKPINFYCGAPGAKSVQIAGDFNRWRPMPMRQREDGWWFIQVLLTHGHHQYHFLVDGHPVLDPQASGTACNRENERVSLLAVS
jgi:1,4-alpha-glucan branching enzyme